MRIENDAYMEARRSAKKALIEAIEHIGDMVNESDATLREDLSIEQRMNVTKYKEKASFIAELVVMAQGRL